MLIKTVAIDICKLTLDYMSNGSNTNKFQTIASKYMKNYHFTCFRKEIGRIIPSK